MYIFIIRTHDETVSGLNCKGKSFMELFVESGGVCHHEIVRGNSSKEKEAAIVLHKQT